MLINRGDRLAKTIASVYSLVQVCSLVQIELYLIFDRIRGGSKIIWINVVASGVVQADKCPSRLINPHQFINSFLNKRSFVVASSGENFKVINIVGEHSDSPCVELNEKFIDLLNIDPLNKGFSVNVLE